MVPGPKLYQPSPRGRVYDILDGLVEPEPMPRVAKPSPPRRRATRRRKARVQPLLSMTAVARLLCSMDGFPGPDASVGDSPRWKPSTITRWMNKKAPRR